MSTGRNDPCPCGSGRKFKHCHGAPAASTGAAAQERAALYNARAADLQRAGRHAEAVAAYREALLAAPRMPELHFNLGSALHAQGRLDEAIASYREALALRPDLVVAHGNLGNALAGRGDFAGAVHSYRAALACAPDHVETRYNLAVALQRAGRIDEAVAGYREVLARKPAAAAAQYNLAIALEASGRLDDAIAAYRAAAALRPDDADIRGNLAHALLARGAVDEAIACYAAALERRPGDAMLHNDLGNALDRRGDVAGALASYARALAHGDTPAIRGNFARCVAAAGSIALDEPLRALITRALTEAWVRPADLARACCAAIDPARPEAELARDPLLAAVLTSTTVRSVALEQRLTELRRAWLAEALAGDDDRASSDDALAFRCALARGCFVNEYVFDCEAEAAQVGALRIRLDAALSAGQAPGLASLVAGASYFALAELQGAQALLGRAWPAAVAALLQQQVVEPLEERRLGAALPRLTPIRDEVSRRVRAQYEENPYPRWVRAGQVDAQESINADLRRQFPLAAMTPLAQDAEADVLVAGCGTGQEPVELAKRWPAARILAVDLSAASLAYAARQTRALGVANVDYAQADVLELPAQPRRFDIVSAVGVLHHLADPAAGLRALVDVLRPGGLMRLGFYSERARRDIVAARDFIARQGYAGEIPQIRRCRRALIARGEEFARVVARSDFYATSECRDLLFHVQEHRLTLPAIAALLAAHGLRVVGMLLEPRVLQRYVERFPDDPAAVDFARLDAFEDAFPDTFAGMYRLWVQKPSAAAPTRRP